MKLLFGVLGGGRARGEPAAEPAPVESPAAADAIPFASKPLAEENGRWDPRTAMERWKYKKELKER